MYCHSCAAEYVDGVSECPECGSALQADPPAEPERPTGPLVEVFRSADTSLLPVIESVLRGAGIEFLVQGEEGQSLFPLGPVGGGPDRRFLGAVVRVREGDAEQARGLLQELPSGDGSANEEE